MCPWIEIFQWKNIEKNQDLEKTWFMDVPIVVMVRKHHTDSRIDNTLKSQNCSHFNQLCAKSFNLIFKVSLEPRQRSNQRRDEGAADDCPVSSFSEPRTSAFFPLHCRMIVLYGYKIQTFCNSEITDSDMSNVNYWWQVRIKPSLSAH